jgi:uncharacterized protein (DUF1330 family)
MTVTRLPAIRMQKVGDGCWDCVVLMHYPPRAPFLEMTTSPEYAAINVDRKNGVEDHVILMANQTYSKLPGKAG